MLYLRISEPLSLPQWEAYCFPYNSHKSKPHSSHHLVYNYKITTPPTWPNPTKPHFTPPPLVLQELTTSSMKCSWSLSELMQAITILSQYHALSSFVFSCNIDTGNNSTCLTNLLKRLKQVSNEFKLHIYTYAYMHKNMYIFNILYKFLLVFLLMYTWYTLLLKYLALI